MRESTEINRGYLNHVQRWAAERREWTWAAIKDRVLYGNPTRLLFMWVVPIVGVFVWLRLKVFLALAPKRDLGVLHRRALENVDRFAEQYPLHLYPLVAKAFELACLRDCLRRVSTRDSHVVEVAIGEGSFSREVFEAGRQVTGLDLNPYSLSRAARLPHVRLAVVCDALDLPLAAGSADVLVANNFLHHVTHKEETIGRWARIARRLVFNENTPYWASGWTVPYLLRALGLRRMAERHASRIAQRSLQSLESVSSITRAVNAHCDSAERISFLSERTFFYCSLFSFFLRCFGPPTPAIWRTMATLTARRPILGLTRAVARALVEFDAYQDRSTDTYVTFVAESRRFVSQGAAFLCCPKCSEALAADHSCTVCGERYPIIDGMLFLLPEALTQVQREYRPEVAHALPSQHL